MESDVGVMARHPRQYRRCQAGERRHRLCPKGRKEQVEPNDIGANVADRLQQANRVIELIERPATNNIELIQLWIGRWEFVSQYGKA